MDLHLLFCGDVQELELDIRNISSFPLSPWTKVRFKLSVLFTSSVIGRSHQDEKRLDDRPRRS